MDGEEGNQEFTLSDLLIFISTYDRIPTYGLSKKIDVKFVNADKLCEVSTCALNVYLPLIETRKNVLKALEYGKYFGKV